MPIPLTESLKIAFNSIVQARDKSERDYYILDGQEMEKIIRFLEDNCPGIVLSDDEIRLLFRSSQQKRFKKKAKSTAKQLPLFL